MKFKYYKPKYNNLKRTSEILQILGKYGFTFFAEKINIEEVFGKIKIPANSNIMNMSTGERIRCAFEELGTTFIKLGQILSTRSDLLDSDILTELKKLQDDVNPNSYEDLNTVFFSQFNKNIEDKVKYINKKPLAAASIGQVYFAVLETGDKVIIKIQRPNIENTIRMDLDILRSIARLLDEYLNYSGISFIQIYEEFSNQILRELDYNFEARNCDKFREIHKNDYKIYIPEINCELTSQKVLTMEWIDGIKINEIENNDKYYNKIEISQVWIKAIMKQVFIHGFFHADPHPGNILILKNNKIALIDFGMVGFIDKNTIEFISEIFIALTINDTQSIVDALFEMDAISMDADVQKIYHDLNIFIHYYYSLSLSKINITELLTEFLRFCRENNLKLPSQVSLLSKTLITLEGGVREINPSISISEILTDFAKDFYKDKLSLKNIALESKYSIKGFLSDFKSLPRQLRILLKSIEKNNIKIAIDDSSFVKIDKTLNHVTNIISISLIIAGLIVGSSLVITTKVEPTLWGYPVLGIIGYLASAIMGLVLIISIVIAQRKR